MLAACGNRAVSIKRVATGPLFLGDLPVGHWREMTSEELERVGITPDPRHYIYSESKWVKAGADQVTVVEEEGFKEEEIEEL